MSKPVKLSAPKQKLLNSQYKILATAHELFDAAASNLRLAENAMDLVLDQVVGEGTYIGYDFQDGKVVVNSTSDPQPHEET